MLKTVAGKAIYSCGFWKPWLVKQHAVVDRGSRVLKRYTNREWWNSMQFWIQETESAEKVYNRGYWKLWLAWNGVNLGMLKTMTHEISCQYYQLQDKPSLVVDIYISDTNRVQSMFRFPINRFPGILQTVCPKRIACYSLPPPLFNILQYTLFMYSVQKTGA